MLAKVLTECPRCSGTINRENHAIDRVSADRTDQFIYCEFCGYGVESSHYSDGDVFVLDFQASTEPKQFDFFLHRLEAARVA